MAGLAIAVGDQWVAQDGQGIRGVISSGLSTDYVATATTAPDW